MKVNITYKMHLEEIPNAVGELIFKTQQQLADLICPGLTDISKLIKDKNNIVLALQKLDEIRQKLADLDQDLEEEGLMIAQYQKTTAELYLSDHQDVPSQPEQAPQLPSPESLKEMREKALKTLREELADSKRGGEVENVTEDSGSV